MMPVMVASVELGSRAFEALEEADSSKKDDICPVDVYRMGDDPHAFIQWKGTDVCADVYCSCGHAFHVDDDFVYAVKCPNCGKDWELEPLVRLVPQTGKCPWHEPKVVPLEGDRE